MIICYSGTGNSLEVAQHLARELGDSVLRIEGEMLTDPSAHTIDLAWQRRVVWCFPVYSWGVPPVVKEFISKITLTQGELLHHYMVATCGDDAGLTDRQWRRLITARCCLPISAYTVEMPNTYTLMKGFDVDPKELEQSKLSAMPGRVEHIARSILSGSEADEVTRGSWARVKSGVIYPWFVRHAMSPKPFHSTEACVGCGLCSRSCPMGNIAMQDSRPMWHDRCALCLRCYHICPQHAVAYGKATRNKGQYINQSLHPLCHQSSK